MGVGGGLRITRLRIDFIYSLDPGYWIGVANRQSRFTFMHDPGEVKRVTDALRKDFRVYAVEPVRSLFDDTHRRDHATLTTINFHDIAPLNIRLTEQIAERIGVFHLELTHLRLSRDGPIAFPFTARYVPEGPGRGLPVELLLRELTVLRESSHRLLQAAVHRAFEIVAATSVLGPAVPEQLAESFKKIHSFEIFDFDYETTEGRKPSIWSITSQPGTRHARELAGLIRLSRPEVWDVYRDEFLTQFFQRNLGNRTDELWIFHGFRLIRHHPEETQRADVQLWFEDARMAITILLQKATALEFLYWSMRYDLNAIRRLLAVSGMDALPRAEELLAVVEELSNRVVDPLIVERHVSHEFFRGLLRQAADALEIPELSRLCRDRLQDVREAVQSIANQVVSAATLRSSVAMERLTRQMLWLSLVVAILAIGQLLLAARG